MANSPNGKAVHSRTLLKLSGESFTGGRGFGTDPGAVKYLAQQIKNVWDMGVELGVVVGGGNILRGWQAEAAGMDRATADYAGMLGTIINALALQDELERRHGLEVRTQSAINVQQIAEPYIRRKAIRHLEKKRVVIFAGGTGNPFMTTDTAAALRAIEIDAKVLLMAKNKIDGVYASDPNINPDAKKFDFITHREALEKQLGVMDSTALSLCMDNNLPIIVFDLFTSGTIEKIMAGEQLGSLVSSSPVLN
ncbi:MAG: UMP kinase [SAR202 cluster bacterium Casp-Chloro-G4]|nr:UMP kinase [Chloroflexota bacterium]PKB60966.1 MAG: UMP kinase [SAR202 cluster bacterium Casp-Chloro-G4]